MASTFLILLTRFPVVLSDKDEQPDLQIRWYQVAEWLELERQRYAFRAVSDYLVDQFVSFLRARNMTMGQVTWELSGGLRALRSLADMLYEVVKVSGSHALPYGDKSSMGVYVERRKYWIGIDYDRPETLYFATHFCKVDKVVAAHLGIEGVYEWSDEPGHGWTRELDLESEEIHFFARSKASQMQVLENFFRESLQTVRQIEIPGQGGSPLSSEEA